MRLFLKLKLGVAIDGDSIARAIAFAHEQPSAVGFNEMIIRPTVQVG